MKKITLALLCLALSQNLFAQVPAYVPLAGLEGWYPFDGNANNAYHTGKNGVVSGAMLTADRFGTANSAYWLDGNTNQIKLDTAFFNLGWPEYTISSWVNSDTLDNPNNFNHAQTIINSIPHNGVALYYNWGYNNRYGTYAGSAPPSSGWDILPGVRSKTAPVIHTWKHVALVKTQDTMYSLYINGVLDTMYHEPIAATTTYCKIVLGRSDVAVISEGFYGKIDDYGIWSSGLSSCDIRRLTNSNKFLFLTAQPVNVATSPTSTVSFSVTDTAVGTTHQWQGSTGTGYVNLPGMAPFSGVTTTTLTITGTTTIMHGTKYRCIAMKPGGCTDTSEFATLSVVTTGVNNVSAERISIVPNPTTGDLSISGAGKADIKVYNSIGQLVKTAVQEDRVSISGLPNGLYVVKLYDDKGQLLYSDKVVKQ